MRSTSCAGTFDSLSNLKSAVRSIAVALFDAIAERPWLSAYFMRDTGLQPNALLLYERLGEQVLRLGLTPAMKKP